MTDDKTLDLFGDFIGRGMKAQKAVDEQLARVGRDKGMRESVEHADAEIPQWSDLAVGWVKIYARANPGKAFSTLECRKFAYSRGFMEPPDGRAWGAVMVRAVRERVIESAGAAITGDAKSHARIMSVWRALP